MPRLTDQQKIFAAEYVRSGFDRQQACKLARYSETTWESQACRLLKRPQIKAEIDRLLSTLWDEKDTVEATEIIKELRKIAFSPLKLSNSDKIRALELLGKWKCMWTDQLAINPEAEAAKEAKFMSEAEQLRLNREARERCEQLSSEPEQQTIPFVRPDEPVEQPETA